MEALKKLGRHPAVEPWTAAALRSRAVRPSARFFVGEVRGSGRGTYELRDEGLTVVLEHGTTDAATLDQAFISDAYAPSRAAAGKLDSLDGGFHAIDLGANIGMWSLWLRSRWPRASVTSVEPVPRNVRLLEENLALAFPSGESQAVSAAAGVAPGRASFGGGDFTNGRLLADVPNGDPALDVEVVDAFELMEGAALLKLDIEGGEWPILEDPRFANIAPDVVMLEFHPMDAPGISPEADALGYLKATGFSCELTDSPFPGNGTIWAVRD